MQASELLELIRCGEDGRTQFKKSQDLDRMLQGAGLVHADEVPVGGASAADMDMGAFSAFFQKQYGGKPDEQDVPLDRLLENLGLARGGSLNLAGLMLFGRDPQKRRPAFTVKAVSFIGDEPAGSQYRDSEDIAGRLQDLYRGTISFLTRNLRKVQNGKNFNTTGDLEVPREALEELAANMLLHRDYFVAAPCRVFIFDNRIEFINPGYLPGSLSVEHIRRGVSVIRNPLMVSYAAKDGGIPCRGIGTGIMRALSAVPNLELVSDHGRNLFIARLPRNV